MYQMLMLRTNLLHAEQTEVFSSFFFRKSFLGIQTHFAFQTVKVHLLDLFFCFILWESFQENLNLILNLRKYFSSGRLTSLAWQPTLVKKLEKKKFLQLFVLL